MHTATVIAAATVLLLGSDSSQRSQPFFTGCRSPEQETFSCWWNPGMYSNLSGTPAFKLLYSKSGCQELVECPDYITSGENSCFFSKTYTSIWTGYCLLIEVTTEVGSVWSEPYSFNILDILQPDPPVQLNWTLLNASGSVHYADIIISWAPPSSADVSSGWISLLYQVRFRSSSLSKWKMGSFVQQCSCPLYALETGQEYEVQVRCRPRSEGKFSHFSESLHFLLPHRVPGSTLPAPVVLLPILALMMLVLFYMLCSLTQIKKVLFPPIPVPKIPGVSIEMIQSGQFSNFAVSSSFLSMKLSPDLSEEMWEEFPEACLLTDKSSERQPEGSRGGSGSSGVDPQIAGSIDISNSGCKKVAKDNMKNGPHLDLVPLDTQSGHTALSGHSVDTDLGGTGDQKVLCVFQPTHVKCLAASSTSIDSPAWHSNLLPARSTLQRKKAQSGKVLLLYEDRDFYTHVKDVAP